MGARGIVLRTAFAAAVVLLAAVPVAFAASGSMHPLLGARLSGMGEHGVVNLQSDAKKGTLCWTFDLPTTKGITGTSVHKGAIVIVRLGKTYTKKGCTKAPAMALEHLESAPGSYSVWVDTKGHPGDLRGKLVAGMVHM